MTPPAFPHPLFILVLIAAWHPSLQAPTHDGGVRDTASQHSPTRPSWHLLLALWRPRDTAPTHTTTDPTHDLPSTPLDPLQESSPLSLELTHQGSARPSHSPDETTTGGRSLTPGQVTEDTTLTGSPHTITTQGSDQESLQDSLQETLQKSLGKSLKETIQESLRETLQDSLAESRVAEARVVVAATITDAQASLTQGSTVLRTSQTVVQPPPTLLLTTDQVLSVGTHVQPTPDPPPTQHPNLPHPDPPTLTQPTIEVNPVHSSGHSGWIEPTEGVDASVVVESVVGPSLVPLVGRTQEILTLKGDGKAILAILQVAQGSQTLEDPFHVTQALHTRPTQPHPSTVQSHPTTTQSHSSTIQSQSLFSSSQPSPTLSQLTITQEQSSTIQPHPITIQANSHHPSTKFLAQSLPTQPNTYSYPSDVVHQPPVSHDAVLDPTQTHANLTLLSDQPEPSPNDITGGTGPPEGDPLGRLASLVKTSRRLDDEDEKSPNALDIGHKDDVDDPTTRPIYEEISDALQVDTSIDDVEDFDVTQRHTENTDTFLPNATEHHTNLIDTSLHSLPSTPSQPHTNLIHTTLPGPPSPPSSSTSSTAASSTILSASPATSESSPTTNNSPSTTIRTHTTTTTSTTPHEPTTIEEEDKEEEEITTEENEDEQKEQTVEDSEYEATHSQDWSVYVANVTTLNTSLALNESILQMSPNLTAEEHSKMVLKERGSLMLQLMDPSADPCQDFYQFACGRWNGKFPIRQDKAVDNTFVRLKEDLDDVLRALLEEGATPTDNNITTAVKTLYAGCMNTDKIEAKGATPLLELLGELGGWPVLEGDAWDAQGYDWVLQMGLLRNYNNDILVSEWVAADITNSSNHIIQLDQPELGLPGREYFINPGDHQYRMAYLRLMLAVCELLGAQVDTALRDMTEVLHFETQLARILTAAEERRNLSAVHRRMTLEELSTEVPEIDWTIYLEAITWGNNDTAELVVFGLDYFKKLVVLLNDTDNRTVSNYLLWRFVKNRISNLGEKFTQVKQDYIKVLFGRKTQPERWRSCVTYVSGNLGYVVGAMFVRRYFPQASKTDTDEMISLIRGSFKAAVREATWMDAGTREVALEKVDTIVRNVGYPDYLLNTTYMDAVYSELWFDPQQHFGNVLKMLRFHARTNHNLLSAPVNRTAWVTSPAVVNAYYSRSKNMIVFPAGILQPPFYHPAFPKSLNYGGIGVVIGHEITHGFDDRGRQFDKDGNLNQWWKPDDVSKFYQRASCMLDQYGEYKVEEVGLNINPVNTLGENIADNAGIKIAYKAYQEWARRNEEQVSIPYVNLSHDQLFFLNFGQIWCEVNSPEAMLTKIRSGQHSPNKYRVIGTLSNSEEFSRAFNCPLGSPMNPERKCKVW